MSTTPSEPMTVDQINVELARLTAERSVREAELAAIKAGERQTIEAAQASFWNHVLDNAEAWDAQLKDEGSAALDRARAAVVAGDLTGAYVDYVEWHASRGTRTSMRNLASTAATHLKADRIFTEMRDVAFDFQTFVNDSARQRISNVINDRLATLAGEAPQDLEAAEAWLATHG